MSAVDRFRTHTCCPIIDNLVIEISKRRDAYSLLYDRFGFLTDTSLSCDETIMTVRNLVELYSSDLGESFVEV